MFPTPPSVKPRPHFPPRFAIAMGVASFLLCGMTQAKAGGATLESQWAKSPIHVDGDLGDWAGALAYMPDDDFTLGVRNDSEFVYVAMMLDDPRLGLRALMNGLTVWFDPEAAADASVGIRFPLSAAELNTVDAGKAEGTRGPDRDGPPREGDDAAADKPGRGGAFRDPERVRALLDRASYELDLIDGEGQARRLGMDDAEKTEGVVASIGESKRVIACEFRIPLQIGEGRATAIGASAGDRFGLRIETKAMRRDDRPERRGGFGGPQGGDAPGRGGLGGRGGFGDAPGSGRSGPPSGEREPWKPFAFEIKVVTASASE